MDQQSYRCPDCDLAFTSQAELEEHRRAHHAGR
jgi:transposase-like protein